MDNAIQKTMVRGSKVGVANVTKKARERAAPLQVTAFSSPARTPFREEWALCSRRQAAPGGASPGCP